MADRHASRTDMARRKSNIQKKGQGAYSAGNVALNTRRELTREERARLAARRRALWEEEERRARQGNAVKRNTGDSRRVQENRRSQQKQELLENERRRARAEARRRAEENYQVSETVERNRQRAAGINRTFVIFLTVISISILFASIHYLQLKAQITTSKNQVASYSSEYNRLKEENAAYYSEVTSSVDLIRIKKIAIGRLGMKNPSDDQIKKYKTARSTYVRQYQDISQVK